ncbi:hypothetical protein M408DRAFT_74522 [Serendipita vermifera MAFF 305830]|uniref:Tyr recombinase domain-containing protein n=1 Tax=Serendipita vermifera MAFF 305830 TaxID=933852 RepID=A0A0C3B1E3_SERVB|nr:hypothetical protein M408DRAFT_74522 [Serendipita vermifera MAFF 305830]
MLELPWTKTTRKKGASVKLASQIPGMDATIALCHHFVHSPLDDDKLLCEYSEGKLAKVMDKELLMSMCNTIWSANGLPRFTGHSFRIGGTTSLLLAGIDVEIVKSMGRWSSDAFKLYWRKTNVLFAKHASNVDWQNFDIVEQ